MSQFLLLWLAARRVGLLAGGSMLLTFGVSTAQAQTVVYGLGTVSQPVGAGNPYFPSGANPGDQAIAPFDTASGRPTVPVTGLTRVTGVSSGTLVGMDFRPADGRLYALGYNATTNQEQLYLLNALTGAVTPVGAPNTINLGPADRIGFDFNPVVDRIRVVSSNGTNIRLNPNDGTINSPADTNLAYATTDRNAGLAPGVGTAAYTNSFAGSTSTTLYDIDELNNGILAIQNQPNAGTLNTVRQAPNGSGIRIAKEGQSDFDLLVTPGLDVDISSNTGQNKAYLVEVTRRNSSGLAASNLYLLNLTTGNATHGKNLIPAFSFSPIDMRDIAVPIKPTITSLLPTSATAGDPDRTLVVNGTGFFNGATVFYNGSARTTTFISATQVTAQLPATDLATAGTYDVTVGNAAVPNGPGGVTAPASFTVRSQPLPVELTAFTATLLPPAAIWLRWATASEKNSARFEVERSPDGQHFTRIGSLAAAGSSVVARAYQLVDTWLPPGPAVRYYRLRQVDLDGTAHYSPVRAVQPVGAAASLALFPNPAPGGAATLTGATPGAVVTVLDALGRVVATAPADAAGTAVLTLPAGVARGVYVVRAGPQALRLMVE